MTVSSERKRAAAERAEQIRLGVQQTAVLYARAVLEEDWQVLCYKSVGDWAAGEFGLDRFSAERRKEIVAMLTAAGYTARKIAAVARVSPATVTRDQALSGVSDETPDSAGAARDIRNSRQRAARDREASRRIQLAAEADDTAGVLAAAVRSRDPLRDVTCRLTEGLPSSVMFPVQQPQRTLSDADIETIAAENLSRGSIVTRFGVGEHAAQLGRIRATERQEERTRMMAKPPVPGARLLRTVLDFSDEELVKALLTLSGEQRQRLVSLLRAAEGLP